MYKINLFQNDVDAERCVESLGNLVKQAYGDSSGERTIRIFLLNLYNSRNPATGFNSVDDSNFEMCMDVLFLHRFIGIEIHKCISDGSRIFQALWNIEYSDKVDCNE